MTRNILLPFIICYVLLASGLSLSVFATSFKADHQINPKDQKGLPYNDKFEVAALNNLSLVYLDSLPHLSHDLAVRALKLSKLIRYSKGEATALIRMSSSSFKENNMLESLEDLLESLNISEPAGYASLVNDGYYGLAVVLMNAGKRERAYEYIRKGMPYDLKSNNLDHIVGDYIGLGEILCQVKGDTEGAERQILNALALKPRLPNLRTKLWVMQKTGNFYLSIKKYDTALFYYREAIQENPHDSPIFNGTLLTSIAYIYELENELNKALYYNKLAMLVRKNEKVFHLMTSSMLNIGHTYFKLGNYDSAQFFLLHGLNNVKILKDDFMEALGMKELYELYWLRRNGKTDLLHCRIISRQRLLWKMGK